MPVYKDKERKTWYYAFSYKQKNGKWKQIKKRGFAKKKEAVEAEDKAKRELDGSDNPFFGEIADRYLDWYKERRKESSTKVVKNIIKNHLKPEFEKMKLSQITPREVEKYHNRIIGEYSPHFLDKIHTTLSAIFNYAIRVYEYKTNPAKIHGNFSVDKENRVNYWTQEEFNQFIKVVDKEPYRTFFYNLYYSGARQGELRALKWEDVDFEHNSFYIYKTVDFKGNLTTTKTKSSKRVVSMPNFTMELLQELKASSEFEQKPGYLVFGTIHDPMSRTTLQRWFDKFIEKAEVKTIVMHEFRHSHASYLIDKGVGPDVVAQRLGHSSVATTLDIYSHLYPTKQKEAVARMEEDF